jgi:uncharacterized DUF497 family protein
MGKVYILIMQSGFSQLDGFEWDEGNRDKSRLKHKVSNGECEELFFNQPLIILDDEAHSQEEKRYAAYGVTNTRRRLHIVFTVRGAKYRVISARDMHRKERQFYEDQT